ncbi:MAG: 3-phosphoglycerate dehydrogenase family protein [Absicoccus porci]|uniref:3-phosphoglycerate dehydrogenase n=1 Tax=Absicoccus porci TaxID=2486576 RepID=A0A3N0I2Z5_9FIRM|nr:3-phosphoglycerate dehydrogenase family protein [Absicoccus porci]MDD7330852.1 3-phosphoglycerate dehydrogenase family protein [Absicoccus porci]MDY4739223.1 3-phosphoglycerate dehydrogenase family protein [Absicoccus porci]RNM31288.1 3-phosphoglycerate dehydrogenase [Absicoccus porci]
MYTVKLYNNIAKAGLDQFTDQYEIGDDKTNEDAIVVRSANLHDIDYNPNLKAIARAGAGVNNIDIETCTKKGIAVFNTPGANANAVKELVFAGMLLASRDIYNAITWAKSQTDNPNLAKDMEKQKKKYAGHELAGKTLGIIGVGGAIGRRVANAALRFDMEVHGYDPYMTVDAAWSLSRWVKHENTMESVLKDADFVTIHIPQTPDTMNTINKETISQMKDGVKILNMARGGLVNEEDMLEALDSGKVAIYVTDFPTPKLAAHPHCIPIPHLGASTAESEENCAVNAAKEVMDYLEYGNIANSVNLPRCEMEWNHNYRVSVIHVNKPRMISKITDSFSETNNIENMINKSRGDVAVTMLDLDKEPLAESLQKLNTLDGIIRVTTYHD